MTIHGACPKSEEIFQGGKGHIHAVHETVEEKEYEELVVIECYAVVDPWTVVVHR